MNFIKNKVVATLSKILILMVLVQIISPSLKAQDTYDDWGTIMSLGLSKDITDKVSLIWQEQYRSRDNFSTKELFAHSLTATYDLCKFLSGSLGYQSYQYNSEDNGWESRQKYLVYVTGDYDLGKLNISLRERYQDTQWRGKESFMTKKYIMSTLKGKYDIRDCSFEPFASAEMFSLLNDSPKLDKKWRYEIGSKYKINEHNELDIHLRYTTSGIYNKGNEGKICVGYAYVL